MSFDENKIKFGPGFTPYEKDMILAAMKFAYGSDDGSVPGSERAREMFDNWFTQNNEININYRKGEARGHLNLGLVEIDLNHFLGGMYIDNTGKAVPITVEELILHELVHALAGLSDNTNEVNYSGDAVEYANVICRELGLPERNSYGGVDVKGDVLTPGFQYMPGDVIDRSWVNNGSMNSLRNSGDTMLNLVA